jgi:hypothetical protein
VSNSTSRNVPLLAAAEDVWAPVSLRDSVFGGEEEAQGTSKGRITRTRKIRAPVVPQETNCSSSWVNANCYTTLVTIDFLMRQSV